MPHDAEITRQEVVLKDAPGQHDMVLVEKYEAPASGDGGIAHDPFKAKNAEVAATMMQWLQKHYPGYPWGCVADLAQGIVKFNIPILMGMQDWWVVNLRTHEVVDGMRKGAGQILERYRLRRGRFELNPFLDARAKHSALVVPGRKVPT
jgi:hypothetical protein